MRARGFSALVVMGAAFLILCPLQPQAASRDDLMRIAVDNLVGGWNVMPDSNTYVQGNGLTEIYDGGYEVYTSAGVVDALRRLYVRGDQYIEVTVHGMKSSRSAREFLADRYRMETGKDAPARADWDRFTAARSGGTTAYAIAGRYFIAIVSYSEGDKGKEQTAKFLLVLNEKAKKLLQERK